MNIIEEIWGVVEELTPYLCCIYQNTDIDEVKSKLFYIVLKNYNGSGEMKRYIMVTAKKMRRGVCKEQVEDIDMIESVVHQADGGVNEYEHSKCDMEFIKDSLRDIYLISSENFKLLAHTLIYADTVDIKSKIKDDEIKRVFLNLVRDFGATTVVSALRDIYFELFELDQRDRQPLVVPVMYPTKAYTKRIKYSGVLKDVSGKDIVVDKDTLLFNYPVDKKPWFRCVKSGSYIYKIGYYNLVDDIYFKTFGRYRRDSEYVKW